MGGQRVFAALVATYPWVPASKHQAIGDATAPGAPRRHSEPATTQQDGAVAATRPNKKVASDAQVEGEPIAIVKPDVDTLDLDQRTERTLPLSGMATEPAQLQPAPPREPGSAGESDVNRRYGDRVSSPQSDRSRVSAGRTIFIIGLLAIVSGGATIGYAVTRKGVGGMSPAQTAAMDKAVGQLDGDIMAARGKLQERVSTLSAPAVVRGAIVTNAETVSEFVTRGDLVPANGEVFELGRIDKATNTVEVLLPRGAEHASHDGVAGSYAALVGNEIVLTEITKVVPTQQADQYMGFLSVTRKLALGPAIKSLVDARINGKLVLDHSELAIGTIPQAGAATHEQPLASQSGAKIIAVEPTPHAVMPMPVLVGGIGAAVIGLLLLVISFMGKREAAYSRAFAATRSSPARPRARRR